MSSDSTSDPHSNPAGKPSDAMLAMRLHRVSNLTSENQPLSPDLVPVPEPAPGEVLIRIACCGVCHTEIDEIEGRTPPGSFPVTPGHQVTGQVIALGPQCKLKLLNQRVGVAWIYSSCGHCEQCLDGRENLCAGFQACGRDANGGYAQYMVVPEQFAHPLPVNLSDLHAAPMLCAGSVGYRALAMCQIRAGQSLGLTGFGASGHLVLQMARYLYPNLRTAVFTRNPAEQAFALELGADWAGSTGADAPFKCHAIIDTTPAWKPVRAALLQLRPGGRLIINAIRKEQADQAQLLKLDYEHHLWHEKSIQSVANVTREDVRNCLNLAADMSLHPEITTYKLAEANQALLEIRQGRIRGAKVLVIDQES